MLKVLGPVIFCLKLLQVVLSSSSNLCSCTPTKFPHVVVINDAKEWSVICFTFRAYHTKSINSGTRSIVVRPIADHTALARSQCQNKWPEVSASRPHSSQFACWVTCRWNKLVFAGGIFLQARQAKALILFGTGSFQILFEKALLLVGAFSMLQFLHCLSGYSVSTINAKPTCWGKNRIPEKYKVKEL